MRLSPLPRVAFLLAICAGMIATSPTSFAQDAADERPANFPTGSATLRAQGRPVGNIAFVLSPRGPLIHLEPLALLLDVELRIGPLGASHTLILGDHRAVIGPDEALAAIGPLHPGSDDEELIPLESRPVRNATGLHVPLDFLQRTFGDTLDLQFRWSPDELALDIERREAREIEATLRIVDQGRLTTLEIEWSALPRYRTVASDRSLEIRLSGDRLLPLRNLPSTGARIEHISSGDQHLLIQAAEGSKISAPRLIEGSRPLLIVDVLQQRERRDDLATRDRDDTFTGIRTIVLDPGHGGEETGAIGPTGAIEKELSLLMARALEQRLEERLPVQVLLTRTGDFDVSLDGRTALANRHQADLFVSLHLNSAFGQGAHGAETYFLSREASDRLAAEAAAIENASAETDEDTESDLRLILWDLAQSFHLAESQRLANIVQQELNLALGLRDRGVKQAPFTVLMGARMPAVLVEFGFISNPDEEQKLLDPGYRDELVEAMVRAISRFKTQMEAQLATGASGAAP